jgi:hypothetical protein
MTSLPPTAWVFMFGTLSALRPSMWNASSFFADTTSIEIGTVWTSSARFLRGDDDLLHGSGGGVGRARRQRDGAVKRGGGRGRKQALNPTHNFPLERARILIRRAETDRRPPS